MTIWLRPYQEEAITAIEAAWDEGISRPAVVVPTGGGKTVIFSALIGRHIERLRAEGKRILVLAHREELLDQADAKINAVVPGVWTSVVKAQRGAKSEFADVVVASVQTLTRRVASGKAPARIGMVIVDECHRSASKGYKDVLAHYGCLDERATPTVGFTATLTRMDGGLPDVWQSVAYTKKIHWMIKQGFLVPPKALSIEVPGLNLANTRVTAGDLNTADLASALEGSKAFEVIAQCYRDNGSDRPGIVFMPNVATTHLMSEAFNAVGLKSEVVVGAMGRRERLAAYERYNRGETQILTSCMTLTEGFDAPHTSCVVIGRPTLNPGLYIQMVGRGLRLADGKSDCLVLDVAGASLRHNLAGVNDLESDCEARCDCDCLSCGCSDRCKCGICKCGCRCIEQHEGKSRGCSCAGTDGCVCGCPGDTDGTGLDACGCAPDRDCGCFGGEGEAKPAKEVGVETLTTLTEVDILGEAAGKSSFSWLTTRAGIRFLQVGSDSALFLLPAPDGGFFQGRVDGFSPKAPVTRLDSGAVPAEDALRALEVVAADSDYQYNSKRSAWRRTAASEKQVALLRRMGVTVPDECRKGQASDLLSIQKMSRAVDNRFGKYVK